MLPSDRAEDVVQEALLRTYAVLRSGAAPSKLRPWLFQVAHNAAVDALRSRPPAPVELDPEVGDTALPDQLIESRDTTREVFAAVHALPDRQRDAIVLRELEGRSYDDIGRRLGTSRAAVRQLIVRARQSVRAAAAAFAPAGLVTRFPWLGNSVAGHSAELSAGAGISAASAQIWVTALVTCTMGGSVVVLARGDDQPAPAAKAVDAPTAALSAERTVGTLLTGEARDVTQAELRAQRAEQVSFPGAATGGEAPKDAPAEAEAPAEVAPPPPGACEAPSAGPPAGTAKRRLAQRRRARRSCDPGGPLAVGNTGPNDPPLGGPLVAPEGQSTPNQSPAASPPPEDPRSSPEQEQAAPPPPSSPDPRDVPEDPPADPVQPDPVQP